MLPRPATMITAVVVTFAIAGVLRLSTRGMSAPTDDDRSDTSLDSAMDPREIEAFEATLDQEESPSTPDAESTPVTPAPPVDPTMIDELLDSIGELEELARQGRSACAELGEPFYDFEQPGPSGQAHIDRWNEFAREWDDDVSRAASRMPPPPNWDADVEITTAYQDVTFAIRELRHAGMGNGSWPVPFESEWSMRFDEARRLLEQSRSRLSTRLATDRL
jgi:hypothetical protein